MSELAKYFSKQMAPLADAHSAASTRASATKSPDDGYGLVVGSASGEGSGGAKPDPSRRVVSGIRGLVGCHPCRVRLDFAHCLHRPRSVGTEVFLIDGFGVRYYESHDTG